MGEHRALWLIAYDISSNRERSRVERVLRDWGFRIQKSVWLVATGRGGIKALVREIERISLLTGQVLLLRLMLGAAPLAVGRPFEDPDSGVAYVV